MDLNAQLQLVAWQFRVLDGWKISYDPDPKYKGECAINLDTKSAGVYGWPVCGGPMPSDYPLHEVLHIAYRAAVEAGREGEELFVQDLCRLIPPEIFHGPKRTNRANSLLELLRGLWPFRHLSKSSAQTDLRAGN